MTTRSTTMTLQEAVDRALDGQESMVLCPAHDDQSPSLSVRPGRTQPVILHCHASCDPESIIGAGGLDWGQVCDPLDKVDTKALWTPAGDASDIYPYRASDGTLKYEVLRVPQEGGKGKRFMQRQPKADAPHGHVWNMDGVQRLPWKLPEVIAAAEGGHTIHITEGEKCAQAVQRAIPANEVATCNSGGAGKWEAGFARYFAGSTVVVYADADDPGRAHAREVRADCIEHGCSVSIVEAPPGVMKTGKPITDVADHLEMGRSLGDMLETTPEDDQRKARTGVDVLDLVLRPMGTTEFVIDKTLAKGERVIIIGFEGNGKSTLLRQLAVQTAAGIHPFSGREMEPRRVLYIDAENHPDQVQESWQGMVGLAARLGKEVDRGMLTIMEEFETERDLTEAAGVAWLKERVYAYMPDLVVMGPLTNMAGKDLREDDPVRKIRNAVNEARTICNSAFIMEHHAPLKSGNDRERPMRPYGSSMLLKWPDYGYGIKPTDEPGTFLWHKFRGARVRTRQWPEALREGTGPLEFPWVSCPAPEQPLR